MNKVYSSEKYNARIEELYQGQFLVFEFYNDLNPIENFVNQNEDEIAEIMIDPLTWLDTYIEQVM